ncbi:MAG: rRNA pseudouridine synthase [Flavobacteriales bacterium]|nr:rRNA pseudouridine synthase [Flavobacteriales bacterium]MBL6872319.1 rRNA pseudouridine synthase [Flavobacteriales bacterium]
MAKQIKKSVDKSANKGRGSNASKGKHGTSESSSRNSDFKKSGPKPNNKSFKKRITKKAVKSTKPGMRLNQFIAHSGISSRREADDLIKAGLVEVNGKIVIEMGFRVLETDVVKFNNESISSETKRYLLLNKPKDFLTLTDDPRKKNVFELIAKACKERIYPVGRLDKQTSGLLLFTNDGELSKKLTNPRKRVKKIFHVTLDKNLKSSDMQKIVEGVMVDGYKVDIEAISYIQNSPKKEVGVEIHIGKNSTLKNVFDKIGYKIVKLDRVYFAGLTKKDISRGRYRFLSEKEISMLKMI